MPPLMPRLGSIWNTLTRTSTWLDRGDVRFLTRTGLDWTGKYLAIAVALPTLPARQAHLNGELCGVRPDGSRAPRNGGPAPTSSISSSTCGTSTVVI
jgi:hypothetical protein